MERDENQAWTQLLTQLAGDLGRMKGRIVWRGGPVGFLYSVEGEGMKLSVRNKERGRNRGVEDQ